MTQTIVMIHGAFCAGWAFEEWIPYFENLGFVCYAPDLPYHDQGPEQSPDPRLATVSLLDYARWLELYIDKLELDEPPILIGHSMGGLLAQILAARRKASGVILLAPSAPWGVLPSTEHEIFTAMGLTFAGPFWSIPLMPSYSLAAEATLDRLPPDQRRRVFSRFVPESGQVTFEIMYWAMDMRKASRVNAAEVTCPVLVLSGEKDRVNPPTTARQIALRYRDRADFQVFDNRSHWLHGEPGWESIAGASYDWMRAKI